MYPGRNTRMTESTVASATTISPKTDLVNLTGSTAIATIDPPFEGFSGIMVLVPKDGTIATTTAGNISIVVTMAQNRATVLVYSAVNNVWAPGAIS